MPAEMVLFHSAKEHNRLRNTLGLQEKLEQQPSLRSWEVPEAPASTAEEQHPSALALPCKLLIMERSPMISLRCRNILILT